MAYETVTLADGSKITVNPKVNALTMKNLRDEGFKTKLMLNAMLRDEEFDDFAMIDAVYLAYRQANPKGMNYEKFLSKYELDTEEAAPIFMAVISRKGKQKFAEAFKAKTNQKKQQDLSRK